MLLRPRRAHSRKSSQAASKLGDSSAETQLLFFVFLGFFRGKNPCSLRKLFWIAVQRRQDAARRSRNRILNVLLNADAEARENLVVYDRFPGVALQRFFSVFPCLCVRKVLSPVSVAWCEIPSSLIRWSGQSGMGLIGSDATQNRCW